MILEITGMTVKMFYMEVGKQSCGKANSLERGRSSWIQTGEQLSRERTIFCIPVWEYYKKLKNAPQKGTLR